VRSGRLSAAAVLALAALALALRNAQRRFREELAAPPTRERPPLRSWPPAAPAAPVAAPRPAPPQRPAAPQPGKRKRKRTGSVLATILFVLCAALLAASFLPSPNLNSFQATLPGFSPTTTQSTTSTTPTTTSPGSSSTTPVLGSPFCVEQVTGWKHVWVPAAGGTPPALVLTNFTVGRSSYEWGLLDPRTNWIPGDVMVAVVDWTKAADKTFRRQFVPGGLQVRSSDIGSYGNFPTSIGHRLIRLHGLLLEVFAEARPPEAVAFAAANKTLRSVQVCAAQG